MSLRAATRGSELARWQTDHVAALLRRFDPGLEVEAVVVETAGDRDRESPLSVIGGKGVFVKEVQAAVLDGRADLAVHSAKDLPAVTPDELVVAAVSERGDPRDALVGARLDDLPPGGLVATGSARRRAQLAWLRPDLTFAELRGNVPTRVAKAADHDAVIVAATALDRLGIDVQAERLDPSVMLPQVGQGALAVECRSDDAATRRALAAIEHAPSRRTFDAERAFLARLGGDCDLPAGAHATLDGDEVVVEGVLADLSGSVVLRHLVRDPDPAAAGTELARYLLDDAGGADLLTR